MQPFTARIDRPPAKAAAALKQHGLVAAKQGGALIVEVADQAAADALGQVTADIGGLVIEVEYQPHPTWPEGDAA